MLRRIIPVVLFAHSAFAQSVPIVQAPKVVVEETLLTADAAGATNVHLDATAPIATRSITALADHVANLHVDAGGAGSFGSLVTLRGLSNTPYFSDPSVTVYFDDLPLGNVFTYPTGLFGFASATIVRGPQGAAFGRGGEAGVIALRSIEPGERATGELRASAGNFGTRTAALEIRSARTEKIDAAVSGAFLERDGFITNTTLGRRVDDQEFSSASARVRLRPAKASEFTLQLLGSRHRDGAQPLVPLGGPLFSVARGREGATDSDFGGAALKAAFDTTLGRLTATTSRTEWRLEPYDNRLVLPPTIDSRLTQSQRLWNEEVRLASAPRADTAWHLGAWFSDGTTDGDANRGIVLPFGVVPIEVSNFSLHTHALAAFGEATIEPAPRWRVTAGFRAEETKRTFVRRQRVPAPAARFAARRTFDSFLPKLAASYALSDVTNISAGVALGTKPGGWSAYTDKPALAGFAAEKTAAFDAGLDTTLANKTLTLAARAFAYAIRDYQIERSFNATDYLVVNAPRARSLGGEVEASWRVTRELTLTATFGLTEITLREFTDPITGRSYAGRRAPYAPEHDAHASATYRAASGWFAAADVAATGRTFFDESENARFASRAHAIAGARLGYEAPHWRAAVFGENLFDARYTTLIIPGVRHAVPGAPRTWGVEAALKW